MKLNAEKLATMKEERPVMSWQDSERETRPAADSNTDTNY